MSKAINTLSVGIFVTCLSLIINMGVTLDLFGYILIGLGIILLGTEEMIEYDEWLLLKVVGLIILCFLGDHITTHITLLTLEMLVYYRVCNMLYEYDKKIVFKQIIFTIMFTIIITGMCFGFNFNSIYYSLIPATIILKLYYVFGILFPIKKKHQEIISLIEE